MEPKHVIGLSPQECEHSCRQEFELGAAQKRNVQSHGHMFRLILIFLIVQPEIKNKERLLIWV